MAHGPRYRVPFRRRRIGKTDYRRRKGLLMSGEPRLVVRRTSKHTYVQLVSYRNEGDRVLCSAASLELEKYGWKASGKSIPAAYLTGYLAGKRAAKAGIDSAVLDIGLAMPHSGGRLFGAMKGALDAGIDVPHSESALPHEERLGGKHISEEVAAMLGKVKAQIDSSQEV